VDDQAPLQVSFGGVHANDGYDRIDRYDALWRLYPALGLGDVR
jgi:hypothetical protein